MLKSTAPRKLGVVLSATPADGKRSSAGRTITPLGEFVLQADGGDHADILSVHGHLSGSGLQWAGATLGLPLEQEAGGDASVVTRRPRWLVSKEGCFLWASMFA